MTERQKEILNLLMETDYMTAGQIGESLHLSDRTVRSEIREINHAIKREVIKSKRGQGFWTDFKEPEIKLHAFGQIEEGENLEWEIVRRVLFEEENSYLELADELYISDTFLTKIIGRVNRRMQRHCKKGVIHKQNGKLVLELSEEDKRNYYSIYVITRNLNQYFELDRFQNYFEYADISWIRNVLFERLKQEDLAFYDTTIVRLLVEIAVLTERIAAGFLVTGRKTARKEDTIREEDKVVMQIADKIGSFLGMPLPLEEYEYFSQLFRNDFYHMEGLEREIAAEFLDKILVEIHVEYGFDFSKDQEFYKEMMAQLIGTLRRTENSQYVINPVLHRMKAQYPLEYDIAIFFADRFNRLMNCKIGEDEVGLIAIHFIRAMETSMMHTEKKVALINPFGKQVKELMKKRLDEMGECKLKIGYTYSVFDLPEYFPKDILAVLTTVPLEKNPTEVPVILCRNFLDYREKEKLLTIVRNEQVSSVKTYFKKLFRPSLFFPDMEFESREQAIAFMCSRLLEQGYVDEEFQDSVMKREAIAPTAFEEGFAFAHGVENKAKSTAICTCLLKNKLAWGEYNVRIVFLFALSPSWNHRVIPVYNVMIDNLMKMGAVKRLSKIENCQKFVEMLL